MLRNLIGFSFFAAAAVISTASSADIVQFNNGITLRDGSNTSATTAFVPDTSGNGTFTVSRNTTVMGVNSDTQRYFWEDPVVGGTGIKFQFDVTYSSAGGNLFSNGGGMGVAGGGANGIANSGQSLTYTVSNLIFDVSNYVDGSVGAVVGPVVVAQSALGIGELSGQNRNGGGVVFTTPVGSTAVGGGGTLSSSNVDGSILPRTAFGDTGATVTATGSGTADNQGWRGRALEVIVRFDVVSAVPEPGSAPLMLLGIAVVSMRRRGRKLGLTPAAV